MEIQPDNFYSPSRIVRLLENYSALEMGRLLNTDGEVFIKKDWPPYMGHGSTKAHSEVEQAIEIKADLDSAMNSLHQRARRVLELRYKEGYDEIEIARKMRRSEMRIRLIKRLAIGEMAKFLGWREQI